MSQHKCYLDSIIACLPIPVRAVKWLYIRRLCMCDFLSLGSMLLCCGGKGGDAKDPYEAHHFHIQEPESLKQPTTRHYRTEVAGIGINTPLSYAYLLFH